MDIDNNSNEQILTLTELGLTTTQAKVYLALVKSRNMTAQKISIISAVSRPDVYRVLNELQEAGLVEKIISKPEEFQAITIEEGITRLLQKRMRKTEDLQSKGLELVQSIKRIESPEIFESAKREFVLIPSKGTAYARSERMLNSIQRSIYFVGLTSRISSWFSQYSVNMEQALARKVDCRIIIPRSNTKLGDAFLALQKYPNFQVRTIDETAKASFSIWDEKEVLIVTSISDMSYSSGTLWSNNQSLINLCADYFKFLWQKG